MKKNKFGNLWILAAVSGVLLAIPYVFPHCGIVALVAFLPLFAASHTALQQKTKHFWICYYSSFLIWNIIATWWIWYATAAGAVAAIILNSLQMAVIFRIFRALGKRRQGFLPYLALAFMWCAWEYCYQGWQVSWPWLNLGNSFAQSIKHIQWYEITGSTGGSLWVLLINGLLFNALKNIAERKPSRYYALGAILLIAVPSIASHIRYASLGKQMALQPGRLTKEVVVLQPNIDPYTDKFSGMTQKQQDEILLSLAENEVTDSTFLTVAPETFFNPSLTAGQILENSPSNPTLDSIRNFAAEKGTNFIFGAVTYRFYHTLEKPTVTARPNGDSWYDVFNTAISAGSNSSLDFYHKSKLVIMAETVPYINGKSVFSSLGLDLGGGFGNFGKQESRSVFDLGDGVKAGTAVCYESVFGNFFREYILAGANLMTIITNDGWWRNTSGHIQHLHYASLRAIETRRYIARSANTGISAIINLRGDIISPTPWWEKCAIRGQVFISDAQTPFVKYGDLVGYLSCWLSLIFLLGYAIRAW